MNKPDIIIVDREDNPIGSKPRADIVPDDTHRVSALWLTGAKTGQVLIAQRKLTKKNNPGKWSAAAAGTVEVGESYNGNMTKEIAEELGIEGLDLRKGPKQFISDSQSSFFCQWYRASVDEDSVQFSLQEEEVESVRWVSEDWLQDDVMQKPDKYVSSMPATLKILKI